MLSGLLRILLILVVFMKVVISYRHIGYSDVRVNVHRVFREQRRRHHHARDELEDPTPRNRRQASYCPTDCKLHVPNMQSLRASFQDFLEDTGASLVYFKIHFKDYNESLLEDYPYMGRNFRASEWVWASESVGRKMLGLPLDADVLSLYILDESNNKFDVQITTVPSNCLIMHSPECRLYAVRKVLIHNVTRIEKHKHRRDFVCHKLINNTNDHNIQFSYVLYRCCDSSEFRKGNYQCQNYSSYRGEITTVLYLIHIIAVLFTLFSPVIILKVKLALKFDIVTKFFRASLKHGITGQRNYVIRISSRQLINLSDPKPFSLPRFLLRILFHCYGEGRCCIHWWAEWRHQPGICRKDSNCRSCWILFFRFFAVVVLYPSILYAAVALYAPKLGLYASIVDFVYKLEDLYPVYLHANPIAITLVPSYSYGFAIWTLFSFVSFIYTILLLSWPNNPLEKCLLHVEGRKPYEHPIRLYDRMTRRYKNILQKLAYGDYETKQHFFRIRWCPWGCRRLFHFVRRLFFQIPIINVCLSLTMFDAKLFQLRPEPGTSNIQNDETQSTMEVECPGILTCCKGLLSFFIWLGFVVVLGGYCTAVYLMAEFVLNVLFFTALGAILHPSSVLPWICLALVILFYVNDTLSIINREHKEILKLIDENSPRISAVEEPEDIFREGAVQILRTHKLATVTFSDGDNTEYVSKELYYNVCSDLKCGWSNSVRRIFVRLSFIIAFVLFIFIALAALGALTGSHIIVTIGAIGGSIIPKLIDIYVKSRPGYQDPAVFWSKIMPDILDRHIRVDRTLCVDDTEEELTTYDVRPVGLLEMDIPRMIIQRSLRLWKFPWMVSADQQTQSHETFIIALANKLAAASFLSKVVTRAYSPNLDEENVIRQWCLLVENCILEGSATASSINGVPVESIRLFPRDVQPLVSAFNAGGTIDNVVDNINRELYGPFSKGVLVTIGNTTFAMCKINDTIFAFNSSCHGDQVTDLFGAVLVATEFNTQNLQSTIKFIVDPYSPDSVPVYSIVPTEGFVFRSPEIMEAEIPVPL